ncbi:MAG: PAS domain S-box protein, partial [Chloroflexota bacterium]
MYKLSKQIQKSNIQTRLIVYYVAFALATVAMVAYFAYTQAAKSLRSTVEDKLHTIAELKVDFLNHWVDEQQRNAIFLASLPELRTLSGVLLNPAALPADHDLARDHLTSLVTLIAQRTTDFQDVQIIDPDGNIVISAATVNVGKSQFGQPFFTEGQTRTYTEGFYKSDLFGKTTLTIATPLFDDKEKRIGVFALHFNMKQVDNFIREDLDLNDPIQSYLITRQRAIITDDPIALSQYPEMHSPAIDLALAGGEGTLAYINHNGIAVIGKYLPLTNQNAVLLVEIDESTALWPARRLAMNIVIAGLLISLVLILVVIILAQRITAPLRALTETASRISTGDLDASAPVLSDDEVGTLAQAFNAMTEKLRQTLAGLQDELHERKHTEDALRESEEQFRKVFHSSPVAICITTLEDGRLLDANYAYWDLTGYDPNNSLGRTAEELTMWDIPHARREFVERLKQKRSLYEPDDHFYHADGSLKQVISFYELIHIRNEDCILAMFYDMSAQKQTMDALQQSEARIRALLEAMPDMILEISADGLIINMVPPKGREAVMPPERFTGRQIFEVFSEVTATQALFAVEHALETKQMTSFEFESVMDQKARVMEARIVASASDTAIIILRDITERKWIESEREKLINSLELAKKESETLRESLASIITTFDLEQVVERILDQIKLVIPYDTASVWRVDDEWQMPIITRDL